MSTILEIQEAIVKLSESERTALEEWLDSYEEDDWDRQITADAASGKLNFMTEEVERAKRDGTLLPLPGEI
ncbi:MAG: hypothetical protein FJ398_12040 [Verrucomicrobia bacterium]|nr:hypothetical protein [Verrucomicrobiota bacterium]